MGFFVVVVAIVFVFIFLFNLRGSRYLFNNRNCSLEYVFWCPGDIAQINGSAIVNLYIYITLVENIAYSEEISYNNN